MAALRARYERLAEMHQEKGASECLPETRDGDRTDCGFELVEVNSAKLRMLGPDPDPEAGWRAMRSGYYRSLLGRGLVAFEDSDRTLNPLQLGAIASTDGHFAAAGFTEEATFTGGVYAVWADPEALLASPLYNPGGLVAVWAEENTRASIFDALQRRRNRGEAVVIVGLPRPPGIGNLVLGPSHEVPPHRDGLLERGAAEDHRPARAAVDFDA